MRTRKTIEQTEELFETLFEISTQGILIHDNGTAIDYNPAFAKMIGYKNGELIGANAIDTLVSPEYRKIVRDKMLDGFEKPYELNAKNKSGNIFPVMIVSSRDVPYKSRNLRLTIVHDITEQKIADKNLRRSEAFLNTIVEDIPDIVFVKNTEDFSYVLFNKAGEELLGYQKKDLIGKTDFEIFPEKEAKFFRKEDKEMLERGNLVLIPEETLQTKHNGQRVITTKKLPIMHKDGKPKYILAKGSTFIICLPVTKKRKGHGPYESEVLPSGTERILFVNDENLLAKMGGQLLSQLGYSVTTRNSSTEALALFKANPNHFDLLVTDMTMPNMTGDVLATELMSIRPDIPVIICNGYSKNISEEIARRIGIKDIAHKPVTIADMAKTVRKILAEANFGK